MKEYKIYIKGGGWYTGMEGNQRLPAQYIGVAKGTDFIAAVKQWANDNPGFEKRYGDLSIHDGKAFLWGYEVVPTEEEATDNGKYSLEIKNMETKCLECKHFGMWDGDPVCFHEKVFQITLPDSTEDCDKHEREENDRKIELHKEEWEHNAPYFFDRYFIDKALSETYLKYHPEHEEMIKIIGEQYLKGTI